MQEDYIVVKWNEKIRAKALDLLSAAFEKNGVRKDFSLLYPRVFGNNSKSNAQHFAVMRGDKVCASVSNCDMEYHVGKEVLKISSSGNVAVDKDERGRGFMKVLFDAVDKELESDSFDLSYLHGARTRYNYFGYELCGVEYRFLFDISDLSKHFENKNNYTFLKLDEHPEYVGEAIEINEMQKVYTKRTQEDFPMIFRARLRCGYAVLLNGELMGTFAFGEGGIKYLTLKSYKDFAAMVFEFLCFIGEAKTQYDAPDYNKELMKNAMKYCSGYEIANPANFKILNFKKVVRAFLQLKCDNEGLCDGEITLESDLFGKYTITVAAGVANVLDYEGEPEYTFKGFEIYDFLFNFTPNIYGKSRNGKMWFPLPINAPYLA